MAAVRAAVAIRSLRKYKIVNNAAISRRNLTTSSQTSSSVDFDSKVTHTGQKFDDDDYRLVRFSVTDKHKEVNEHFAIDLIAEIPPQAVNDRSVYCDGGGGPLGHPKVFINLDKPGNQVCGYCGLRFYQKHSH